MTSTAVSSLLDGRVLPVLTVADPAVAEPLAHALVAGGIRCAEVTLRTPAAVEIIRIMATVPGIVVGAGTVLETTDVDRVAEAGARFVVSPGLHEDLVVRCRQLDIVAVPGVLTPTEVMRARRMGLRELKFFPAESAGGAAAVAALGGPFPDIAFIPTGGISPDNAGRYLSLRNVVAVGGSWITPPALLTARDFTAITQLAAQTTMAMTGGA